MSRITLTSFIILLIAHLSTIGYSQTPKNSIGVNFFFYAGVNYERMIGEQNSLSFSVNKHDWNYAHLHEGRSLVKSQIEYRFYNIPYDGFFVAPTLTYRFIDDPSINEETSFIIPVGWGHEPRYYDITLHSFGLALTGGYKSKPLFDRFSLETSLRGGAFAVNHFSKIKRTNGSYISDDARQNISKRLRAEIALSIRISYSF